MSIYATLGAFKIARSTCLPGDDDWAEVWIQSVPAHVGHPAPGRGYEGGDPYAGFLPPPPADPDGPPHRAVIFVGDDDAKDGQRYLSPLLVMTGAEYAAATFADVLERVERAIWPGG